VPGEAWQGYLKHLVISKLGGTVRWPIESICNLPADTLVMTLSKRQVLVMINMCKQGCEHTAMTRPLLQPCLYLRTPYLTLSRFTDMPPLSCCLLQPCAPVLQGGVAKERPVFYRERAAGCYGSGVFLAAQVCIRALVGVCQVEQFCALLRQPAYGAEGYVNQGDCQWVCQAAAAAATAATSIAHAPTPSWHAATAL
jgi:hypothetical protein